MKLWENNIRKVVPYVPGEQPDIKGMIKLNTNENPYPPAPSVQKALSELDGDRLRLYPDPTNSILVESLAARYKRQPEEVFVGVGSDDVLALAFLTFFNSGKKILFPDITYSFYEVWADLYRIPYERPALDSSFHIVKEDYYKENGGIVIANPNAPTGVCENISFIEDIVKNNPDVVVILDEAYIDFGGISAVQLIDKYDNLLVVQTFSKSRSLAGMRIGFCMGNRDLIQALNQVKYSFNSYTMNQTSLICGAKSVEEEEYFRETIQKIVRTREKTEVELKQLGFHFPESKTNFIFASHERVNAVDLYQAYRDKNIFVRHFKLPRIDNYLRITIGTDDEMERFLECTREYIKFVSLGRADGR